MGDAADMTNEELAKWCDDLEVAANLSGMANSDTVAARHRLVAARLREIDGLRLTGALLSADIPPGLVVLPAKTDQDAPEVWLREQKVAWAAGWNAAAKAARGGV